MKNKIKGGGPYSYYIFDSYILEWFDELSAATIFAKELSEDLTTFVYDNKTYTLQQ